MIVFETTDDDPIVEITLGGDVVATGRADDIEGEGLDDPVGLPLRTRGGYYVAFLGGAGTYDDDGAAVPAFVGAPGNSVTFDADTGIVFGGAIGRYLGRVLGGQLRVELEATRRESDVAAIAGLVPAGGERRTLTAIFNATVDFHGPARLEPYVGAGIGVAFNRVRQPLLDNSLAVPSTVLFEDSNADVAWQIFAGASLPFTSRVDVFAQVRYLDGGGSTLAGPTGAISDIDLQSTSAEIGFRIRF